MLATLRKTIVTAAAVLLSAGLAACPCLAATNAAPALEETVIAAVDDAMHSDHQSGHNDQPGAVQEPGERSPSHQDHSACDHCDSIALAKSPAAGDGITLTMPSGERQVIAPVAILPSIANLADVSARFRHRWIAPPTLSPVSLKIRLQN